MLKKSLSILQFVCMVVVIGLVCFGCAPAKPAQMATFAPAATRAPELTKAPASTKSSISIKYTAIQANSSSPSLLQDAFKSALGSPDLVQRGSIQADPVPFQLAMGCSDTSGILPPPGLNLFMMASHLVPYSFRDGGKFQAVPPNLVDDKGIQPFAYQVDAFRDSKKTQVGVPVATMPLMLIYNPDKLGSLPDIVTLDKVIELARRGNPLWLPVYMGIGGATFQALGGDNFSEAASLDAKFVGAFAGEASRLNILQKERLVRSATDSDLLNAFRDGKLNWTIHDSSFLLRLATTGYAGRLDVRPFLSIKVVGSSTMSWAWTVPEGAPNADIAWRLVQILGENPAQVRWLLSQGLLPATNGGFDQLRRDPKMADGLLPAGLLRNADVFDRLQKIVTISKPWRIPPEISKSTYEKVVVPTTLNLIQGFLDGKSTFEATINTYLETLPKLK